MRVQVAADNAAYWSISTTMKSEKMALDAVSDAIGLGQAILDVTYSGMTQVLDYLSEVKKLVVMASNEGPASTNGTWYDYARDGVYDSTPLGKIDLQIKKMFDAMVDVVNASSFNGVNLLKIEKGGSDISGVSRFVSGLTGSTVQRTKIDLRDTVMINYDRKGDFLENAPGSEQHGFLDGRMMFIEPDRPATYYNAAKDEVLPVGDYYVLRNGLWNFNNDPSITDPLEVYYDRFLNELERKMEAINKGMTVVGSVQKSLDTYDELNQRRIDNINKGVGRLVDADMNEASTRLKAIQTQQQLAIQSLSIANTNAENVMQLFR